MNLFFIKSLIRSLQFLFNLYKNSECSNSYILLSNLCKNRISISILKFLYPKFVKKYPFIKQKFSLPKTKFSFNKILNFFHNDKKNLNFFFRKKNIKFYYHKKNPKIYHCKKKFEFIKQKFSFYNPSKFTFIVNYIFYKFRILKYLFRYSIKNKLGYINLIKSQFYFLKIFFND